MPKKKSKAAAQQTQTQPLVSDYETDNADQQKQQNVPVQQLSNSELNHLVLQRWSPNLHTILAIAPFAVLYNFNASTSAWEKSDLQGSLFVCQLSDQYDTDRAPSYEVMILNRKHPENLHLPITKSENIEVTEEFVIMHEDEGEKTVGLWMYSDEETPVENRLAAIAGKIVECAVQAERLRDEGVGDGGVVESQQQYYDDVEKTPTVQHGQSIDLATLFGKQPVEQAPQQEQGNVLMDLFRNAKRA